MSNDTPSELMLENILDLTIDNLSVTTIKLYNIIEKIGEGLTLINKHGYFDVYNLKMEQLTGYTKEECNSDKNILHDLFPEKFDLKRILRKVYKLKREGDSVEFEVIIKTKYKTFLNLWVTTTLLNFKGVIWYLSLYRNVTNRKKEENALKNSIKREKEANQLKSAFLANVSHEFRTPLNGILGSVQNLKKDKDITFSQKDSLDIIEKSGRYLLNLIEDVMYLSKIESNQLKIVNSPFLLRACLMDIVEISKTKIQGKKLNFFFEFSDNLPEYVLGDDKKITYMAYQMLANAIKFTKNGSIFFRVWEETGDRIFFSVEDTGIGMEQSQIQTIFQPFKQLSPNLNKSEGSGIGLTIVHKLIELLGGDLKVESQLGKGSNFTFSLFLPVCSESQLFNEKIDKNVFPKKEDDFDNGLAIPSIEKQLSLLPKDFAEKLYLVTIKGDVNGIVSVLNKIREDDAYFKPMVERLMGLLHSFNLKEIHDIVINNLRF
ncbi:MAG: PAS domain S-box protein [Leptospiraceae bacterium]|nr:PAS domain S-box protein [Leptospiraceae bacterium]MCP5497084.1 PAS domain S-box protein [Leptospiraceae bacterium]